MLKKKEFARAQMEQILQKSKLALPDVEIRELAPPDRNRKCLAPARNLSPEADPESSQAGLGGSDKEHEEGPSQQEAGRETEPANHVQEPDISRSRSASPSADHQLSSEGRAVSHRPTETGLRLPDDFATHVMDTMRKNAPEQKGACDWCFRVSPPQFSLPMGEMGEEAKKLFCSETCFSHYRRAIFKAGKVCDNCKLARQDTIQAEEGGRKLNFCSTSCISQYREQANNPTSATPLSPLQLQMVQRKIQSHLSALINHSNNENSAAGDRPTVKVKPDHLLKKPSDTGKIRESDLRRIRILPGGSGRKMAVRDRGASARRLTNGEATAGTNHQRPGAPPAIPPLTHTSPPAPSPRLTSQRLQVGSNPLELLGLQQILNSGLAGHPGIIQLLLPNYPGLRLAAAISPPGGQQSHGPPHPPATAPPTPPSPQQQRLHHPPLPPTAEYKPQHHMAPPPHSQQLPVPLPQMPFGLGSHVTFPFPLVLPIPIPIPIPIPFPVFPHGSRPRQSSPSPPDVEKKTSPQIIKSEAMDSGDEEEEQLRLMRNISSFNRATKTVLQQPDHQQQGLLMTLKRKASGDGGGGSSDWQEIRNAVEESQRSAGIGAEAEMGKIPKLVIKHEIKHKENGKASQVFKIPEVRDGSRMTATSSNSTPGSMALLNNEDSERRKRRALIMDR